MPFLDAYRYSTPYAVQPVHIRDSQSDWLNPPEWSKEALQETLKGFPLKIDPSECETEDLTVIDGDCHFVKERHAELVGKEWAALSGVNIAGLAVSTYDELFDKLVRQPASTSCLTGKCSCGHPVHSRKPFQHRCYQYVEHDNVAQNRGRSA